MFPRDYLLLLQHIYTHTTHVFFTTYVFLLNIVYFSVYLTSNKFYWIEDQLADVSTRFYTSKSWRRRVDRNSNRENGPLCSLLLSLVTLILEILWQTFYITYLQVN